MSNSTEMDVVTNEMDVVTNETNVVETNVVSNAEQVVTSTSPNTTCPVCFDPITTNKNVCSTPCGHIFCFGCMVKCLNTSNTCPYCRAEINDKPINNQNTVFIYDDEDDYDDDDEDDEDDYETISDNEDEEAENNPTNEEPVNTEQETEDECSIEYVESYFKEKGISYINLLSVMFNRYPSTMTKRMRKQLDKKLYDMMDLLDEEHIKQREEIDIMVQNDVSI